jgi:hypothetical protein
MGTKRNPGAFDCHAAALPDEPLFILLARDPAAPHLVKAWAALYRGDFNEAMRLVRDAHQRLLGLGRTGSQDGAKLYDAKNTAMDMVDWRAAGGRRLHRRLQRTEARCPVAAGAASIARTKLKQRLMRAMEAALEADGIYKIDCITLPRVGEPWALIGNNRRLPACEPARFDARPAGDRWSHR